MTLWAEGDVAAGDVRIHYYRTGNGDKPALVLSGGAQSPWAGICVGSGLSGQARTAGTGQ